jgi:hypothetical protein
MAKGDIAALLIGKAKKDQDDAGSGSTACARAVLDAIKADDADALDAALQDWLSDQKEPAADEES